MSNPLIVAIVFALIFEFINGMKDSSNSVPTMISSRAFSSRTALGITAIAEFAGPFLFGVTVAKTIGADIVASQAISLQALTAGLLGAILWNLINKGSVKVKVSKLDEKHWQIQTVDTGNGIPQDAQEFLFESFRQVEGSATRQHGGVGLGLSIVKQLVEIMKGKIVVESEIGKGSTFTATFPLVKMDDKTLPISAVINNQEKS